MPPEQIIKYLLMALIPLAYLAIGIYLLMAPVDFGVVPYYVPSIALILYGFFRAYRVYNQYRNEM
jgi:predicted membrane chloride channel (bestrophin family)